MQRSNSGVAPPGAPSGLSRKAVDLSKNLLSALFMAVRTAKIHDPSNAAFENAVQSVFRSAQALFQATGGFSLRFVEDTVFVNGSRLRFDASAYSTVRTLRHLMEEMEMGGLELNHPPNPTTIRNLILLFTPTAQNTSKPPLELTQDIKMLGVQRMVEDRPDIKVDRRVFAVQCYGKLLLAVREQVDRIAQARACDWATGTAPPRLRMVRVVQDLVELGADRADFLLRLSTNTHGAADIELHGANASLLAIVMGHAMGVERQGLVDIAVAALFHHIGATPHPSGTFEWNERASQASLARLLAETGVGHSSYLRALMVGEQTLDPAAGGIPAHPYGRLIRVAAAYARLVTGFGDSQPALHPLSALAVMYNNESGVLDRDLVDLLINVLRAFPVGCRVVLDTGETATVTNQLGGARWDRPMVKTEGAAARIIDLSSKQGGRFAGRISHTSRFAGHDPSLESPMDEGAAPIQHSPTDLSDLLEGEDVIPDQLPDLLDYDMDVDATAEGPYEPSHPQLADDLELPDEDDEQTLPPADTLPSVTGLSEPSPMTPDSVSQDLVLQAAPELVLSERTPDQPWSALVPDTFGDELDLDDAPDEARLAQLERLPSTHSDTFDEDDGDDTLGG